MIEKGYFTTKSGKLIHAENWYDECSNDMESFCEGLHVYSDNRDTCSYGDGENISSLASLFSCLLSEKQYNIKKLAERIGNDLMEYVSDFSERVMPLLDYSEDVLKDTIEKWAEYNDIPAFVFTDKDLFAENFQTYCIAIHVRNYSSAGDYFYDAMSEGSESEPDEVFWVDRKTFEEWGTAEEDRWDVLESLRKTFEDWANGRVYGISYQEWQEDKVCWTEEEHIGGFLGDNYYRLETILKDALEEEATPVDSYDDANASAGLHAFDPNLNEGVLYERARAQAELDMRQSKLFTDEELEACQNSR